tara:strand:- start:630 stop:878 length:249 start_codon:yes stop_codon:yes gene_type:complete
MNKDIITSRAEEYKMERDWYLNALDIIESIISEDDKPKSETLLERKIKRIEDVVIAALDGEPTTADEYNKGDDIEYKYENKE